MEAFAIDAFDQAALHAIQAFVDPVLTAVMLVVTFFGNPVFWVAVAAGLYWRGQENKGFFLMNLILFTSVVIGALKLAVMRPRPSGEEFQVLGIDYYVKQGFPSAHSALIAAAFSYTYKMLSRHRKAVLAILIIGVGFSRLYLGMHFPTDVVAGIAIGLVIGKANLIARNKLFHRNFKPSKLEDELALIALVAAAVAALLLLQSLPIVGVFIGFYAGFFLFKEMQLEQSILMRRMLLVKFAVGFAFLFAVLVAAEGFLWKLLCLSAQEKFFLYIISGFWISWLWPVLWEKLFKRQGK